MIPKLEVKDLSYSYHTPERRNPGPFPHIL